MRVLFIGLMLGWFLNSPSGGSGQVDVVGMFEKELQEVQQQVRERQKQLVQSAPQIAQGVQSQYQAQPAVRVAAQPVQRVSYKPAKPECRRRPPDALGNIDYWSCL